MSLKIKVKLLNGSQPLVVREKGDWIDLCASEAVTVVPLSVNGKKVELKTYLVPLGVAMKIPDGYEALLAPRSSTFKNYGLIMWNSLGIIDNTYCGNNDEWKFGGIGLKLGAIKRGDRICQFRIQLSQKATIWQKIKWLLTGGKIEFEYVDELESPDRKGFGEGTGKY